MELSYTLYSLPLALCLPRRVLALYNAFPMQFESYFIGAKPIQLGRSYSTGALCSLRF